MKKIIFASLILMASLTAVAAPRIVLADVKEHYVQTETGYNLQFKLIATGEEFISIMEQAQSLSDRLTLNAAEGSNNTYDCIFKINHQNQPEYVHKMLLSLGIVDLEYKGNVKSIDAIIEILYSYQ